MDAPLDLDDRPIVVIFRSPLFNASETFVQAQAAGLVRYQPIIVGLEDKGNARPELRGRLALPASRAERWRMALAGDFSASARRLAALKPKLVHAHFGPDGLRALSLARALGVPLVTTLHGYDVQRSDAALLRSGRLSWVRYGLGKRRLMREGTLFLAVSDALRAQALARGYPAERTLTHYPGVDLPRFGGAGEREPGLILHVARLVEKKGTAVLLDAMARLPEARLVIVGDGPLRRAIEAQARSLGEQVRFLGALSPRRSRTGWGGRRCWPRRASQRVTATPRDCRR